MTKRMTRPWTLQTSSIGEIVVMLPSIAIDVGAHAGSSGSVSSAYVITLQEHGVKISVAYRGHPWENGYAERLIRTLKEEEVHINDYQSITEARERIGHFITQVCYHKRPHSALGDLTPMEFQHQTLS